MRGFETVLMDAIENPAFFEDMLDRLTDHHPLETHESVDARVLTRQQLRAAVVRDLTWLFNATRPEPEPIFRRVSERPAR